MLVTHYQRLLNYIVPDYVHVMEGGRIIKTGGKELALELESARLRLGRGRARGRSEGDRVSATTTTVVAPRTSKACSPAARELRAESPHRRGSTSAARARRSSARTR